MSERPLLTSEEGEYLAREYQAISTQSRSLGIFLDEVKVTMERCGVSCTDAVLDVGCGRGYLLNRLAGNEYRNLRGLDPCQQLLDMSVSDAAGPGAFFDPDVPAKSWDVVVTCHTLHHLRHPDPVKEVRWMAERARKFVCIVEINNTNIPMFLMSVAHRSVEANAYRYNRRKVVDICRRAELKVVHASDMKAGYVSGDSLAHRVSALMGSRPYCMVVARP